MLQLPLSPAPPALQLRWLRIADRLESHVELLTIDRETVMLLQSRESDGETPWPDSPPYQDAQQLPHLDQTMFATGKSGGGHWSVAVELGDNGALTWDVACRVTKPPSWLGSTYLPAPRAAITVDHERQATIRIAGCEARLTCLAITGEAACQLSHSLAGPLAIHPALVPNQSLPATIRWRYRLGPLSIDSA